MSAGLVVGAIKASAGFIGNNIGRVARWGGALFGLNEISKATTGDNLLGAAGDAVGNTLEQLILEPLAEAGVNTESHTTGQGLIAWANGIAAIPFLGNSAFGQWIADFLRDWGEGIQNADTENDGTTAQSTADGPNLSRSFTDAALTGAGIGATIGSVIPGVGTIFGTAVGAGFGAAAGILESETGFLSQAWDYAARGVGLRDSSTPRPVPIVTNFTPLAP